MLHSLSAVRSCSALSLRLNVRVAIILMLSGLFSMLQIWYNMIVGRFSDHMHHTKYTYIYLFF